MIGRHAVSDESRNRRTIEQIKKESKRLSRYCALSEYAAVADGVTDEWDIGSLYEPGSSLLVVAGYRYILKNDRTEELGIWDYEETAIGFKPRVVIPAGSPVLFFYVERT